MMASQQAPGGVPIMEGIAPAGSEAAAPLRFEDLTIDDDLPLLDRVVRYCRSGIALQRLVHVKMLAETAAAVGTDATINSLIALLPPLVSDPESIIRQHLASQILPLCLTCMFDTPPTSNNTANTTSTKNKTLNERGYKVVTSTLLAHLDTLITDQDVDVRRSASDSIAVLALHVRSNDVASQIISIPLRLARNDNKSEDGLSEELRITAANLLGELAALHDVSQMPPSLVAKYITPDILVLCKDSNFRVRRAAVQALPRVLGGSSAEDAERKILPAFVDLSSDDMYRVRKSVGECLVDMSRSLMLLPARIVAASGKEGDEDEIDKVKQHMMFLRRMTLLPVATKLLGETNKFVRHGMMQFLGPFIASFYPLDRTNGAASSDSLSRLLGIQDEPSIGGDLSPKGSNGGLGAQFFPHANGMVSRLGSSTAVTLPTSEESDAELNPSSSKDDGLTSAEKLQLILPQFLQSYHSDTASIAAIIHHRNTHPPSSDDIAAVRKSLLPHFVNLARVNSGDDNINAEMCVYCAYSFPAVVLLLGSDGWTGDGNTPGPLKECFFLLVNGNEESASTLVPLPVKRCLASSLHTVAHILGGDMVSESDFLEIFEEQFLRDSDETVRLNVIRNLALFLSLLSSQKRMRYLPILHEIVMGDAVLGATRRRTVTNPLLLNWRQRDVVAQCLPNITILFQASDVRTYVWPVVQMLLKDTVSSVREDVEWSVPILLRKYASGVKDGNVDEEWCTEASAEVTVWLNHTLLESEGVPQRRSSRQSGGSFSKRQGYCRICAAVALALQLGVQEVDGYNTPSTKTASNVMKHPFYELTMEESKHLKHLLVSEMLPRALSMKDDRVTNVRLTLVKSLRVMPDDIRNMKHVSTVVRTLEEEAHTWEGDDGFYDGAMDMSAGYNASPQHVMSTGDTASTSKQAGTNVRSETSAEKGPASTRSSSGGNIHSEKDVAINSKKASDLTHSHAATAHGGNSSCGNDSDDHDDAYKVEIAKSYLKQETGDDRVLNKNTEEDIRSMASI